MKSKPVKLGDICEIHTGGIPFKKEALSDVKTDYQVLSPKGVENGRISPELRYLKSFEESSKKYLISDGQVLVCGHLLTNCGIAFVSGFEGKNVIVHNGIYRLNFDAKQMNPLFVKMFLESKAGMSQINKLASGEGTTSKRLAVKDLQKVTIPMLDIDEQDELAKQYQKLEDEILKAEENVRTMNATQSNIILNTFK